MQIQYSKYKLTLKGIRGAGCCAVSSNFDVPANLMPALQLTNQTLGSAPPPRWAGSQIQGRSMFALAATSHT